MSRHPHQQVFSSGGWWDFVQQDDGRWLRTYEDTPDYWEVKVDDLHNFSPSDEDRGRCEKCGLVALDPDLAHAHHKIRDRWGKLALPATRSSAIADTMHAVRQAEDRAAEAPTAPVYNPREQDVVLETFVAMMRAATKDGGRKRAAGEKPPWYTDTHEKQVFSHLAKWKKGEMRDPDSGAHPLVHLAWRALAIAYQETYGKVEPTQCESCGKLVVGTDFVLHSRNGVVSYSHVSC